MREKPHIRNTATKCIHAGLSKFPRSPNRDLIASVKNPPALPWANVHAMWAREPACEVVFLPARRLSWRKGGRGGRLGAVWARTKHLLPGSSPGDPYVQQCESKKTRGCFNLDQQFTLEQEWNCSHISEGNVHKKSIQNSRLFPCLL